MPVFGKAGDPRLWEGYLYREEPEGYVVSKAGQTTYLPRDLAFVPGTEWGDTATQEQWNQAFDKRIEPDVPVRGPRPKPERKFKLGSGAGPAHHVASLSLLTIKLHNVVVIKGTEEAGINIKAQNVNVITDGTGTISVKAQGA